MTVDSYVPLTDRTFRDIRNYPRALINVFHEDVRKLVEEYQDIWPEVVKSEHRYDMFLEATMMYSNRIEAEISGEFHKKDFQIGYYYMSLLQVEVSGRLNAMHGIRETVYQKNEEGGSV